MVLKTLITLLFLLLFIPLQGCTGTEEVPTSDGQAAAPTPVPDGFLRPANPTQALPGTIQSTQTAMAQGSTLILLDLVRAWKDKGMEVSIGAPRPGFSGFRIEPQASVRLSRNGQLMEASVFLYSGVDLGEDWTLMEGQPPAPKDGRKLPEHVTTWWNRNTVVIVHSRTGQISTDALAAFLTVS